MSFTTEYDREFSPAAPVVLVSIDGYVDGFEPIVVKALVDSGADGTMLPHSVIERVGARYVDSVRMRGVSGGVL